MRELVIDFETASGVDLKEVGAWRYSEDVTTDVISLSYGFIGETAIKTWTPEYCEGSSLIDTLYPRDNTIIFIAHNCAFEKAIWRNIMVPLYGWPEVPDERWDDTQAACAMRAIPISLDKAAIALRLPVKKDYEGSKITRALSKANKKGYYSRDYNRTYDYNRQDVLAQQELRNRLGPLPEGEWKVWLLDQKINQRGIPLDLNFVAQAQKIVDEASLPLLKEFKELTSLNPGQAVKIRKWINDQGIELDSLNKEIVSALLGGETEDENEEQSGLQSIKLPANVRRALEIRAMVGSASIKKLSRMRKCVSQDGRARGLLQYHGAGPGRWSGRLLQPQNFPRGTLKDSSGDKLAGDIVIPAILSGSCEYIEATVGNPIETVISGLRHAIRTDDKHILLSGDFAQIEARIILALAGQYDKVQLLANGESPYCDMGFQIYKRIIDKYKDTEEYQLSKNSVLGLGFQMGWKKFKLKYAKNKTDEFCQTVVNTYRQTWAPRVPKVWEGLEAAALDTVYYNRRNLAYGVEYCLEDGWLTAKLPSGRKLWYFNPKPSRKAMPWDDTDVRPSWTYQQTKTGQLKTIDAYGGLLTENVVQGLARDLMVDRMFALEDSGFPIILTVHDEIVSEVLKENADETAFKQIMEERPRWAKDLMIPVAVETWAGEFYRK